MASSGMTERTSSVHFTDVESSRPLKHDERKRYLTMKYGQHQIKLIQKRLKVEFWLDAELRKLYDITVRLNLLYPT